MVRVMIILLLAVLQAMAGIPGYLSGTEHYWLRALTYSFFHAGWWHLAVNCLAVWAAYNPKRPCKPCRDLFFPYIIAIAVYPLSFRPVIGFSNVLYALLGLRTPALSSPWWRRPEALVFLAVTVALLFVPRFSATTHIAAFLLGMAGAAAKRSYLKLTRDARRYL